MKKPVLVTARATRPKPAPAELRAAVVTGSLASPAPTVMAAAMAMPAAPAAPVAKAATACRVQTASYVGKTGRSKTLLIRAEADGAVEITALQVLDGFERSMGDGFIRARAPGGSNIGEFETPEAALARAYELCPTAK